MFVRAGIPIVDVPFVSCGGGMGSFVLSNYLRVAGVDTNQIRILSNLDHPWQTYEYLTKVSQIPRPERLRSDESQGCPTACGASPATRSASAQTKEAVPDLERADGADPGRDYWTRGPAPCSPAWRRSPEPATTRCS